MIAVTTSTTTTAITDPALVGGIAVGLLILLLVVKELTSASEGPRIQLFCRHLDVVIVPLLAVFIFIVGMKVADVIY